MKALFDERNSLLYWFPKVSKLGIPVPKTVWIEFPHELGRKLVGEGNIDEFKPYLKKIEQKAETLGYPVFIRTDSASHKHGWDKAAFVRKKSDMLNHIIDTIEFNEMAGFIGLNYKAIVVREFLELDWRFKAFHGNMPVARERRYFVKDGKVLCHHPYWIEKAIATAHKGEGTRSFLGYLPHKLPNKWKEMLAELNEETESEVKLLTVYAEKISAVVDGYWSVDFACSREGKWFLIDMANGYASFHPDCDKKLLEKCEGEVFDQEGRVKRSQIGNHVKKGHAHRYALQEVSGKNRSRAVSSRISSPPEWPLQKPLQKELGEL